KRRNTICISRFFGKGWRKICRQDARGGYWYSFLGTRLNKPLGKTGNFCRASQKPPGKRKNPAALPEKVLPRWKKSAAAASRWQRCQIIGGKMATGSSNDSYSL
ncbi:MAG: hypothetical protein HFF15_08580, partial [Angelakisella sp.]|nr:hypothetical protein [Angelakisella sp.]